MDLDFRDLFYPLVGLFKNTETDRYDIREIYGTAFSINNGIFVTAGHSVVNAVQCERYGIAHKVGDSFRINFGVEYEVFKDTDIAILRVENIIPSTTALKWDLNYPKLLHDIQTVGYPYGLNIIERSIKARAFKGYINSVSKFWRLPNQPAILELSFQCPRGLSGAPIISENLESIIGVVIGNEQTEMEICREKEVLPDSTEQTYIKTEFFTYGVGMCTKEVSDLTSEILNSKVIDYLIKNNLV